MRMQEYNKTAYSDRKIKAKNAPEYSVLKPDTSSDSASEKSKGARWVSASVHTTHSGIIVKDKKLDGEEKDWIE